MIKIYLVKNLITMFIVPPPLKIYLFLYIHSWEKEDWDAFGKMLRVVMSG